MAVDQQTLGELFMEMMPDPSRAASMNEKDIDARLREILGQSGWDVDALYTIGNGIVHMAVQAGQEPEPTIVGAFISGVGLATLASRKGVI